MKGCVFMADMTEEEFIKAVTSDIQKMSKAFCTAVSKAAADEYTKVAYKVIDEFYANYDPISYSRTGNVKNAVKRFYRNHGKGEFVGGVDISSNFMEDYYYRGYGSPILDYKGDMDYKDRVFMYVWNYGKHGVSKTMAVDPESPEEKLNKELGVESSATNKKIYQIGVNAANSVSREVLTGFVLK